MHLFMLRLGTVLRTQSEGDMDHTVHGTIPPELCVVLPTCCLTKQEETLGNEGRINMEATTKPANVQLHPCKVD